jgi:hypothetical protein
MSPKRLPQVGDWIFDYAAATDFSAAQDEIDARLADEDPNHPDSIELRRLMRESERSSEVATALLMILQMCLPTIETRGDGISERSIRVAGTKLITLLWLLRSERMGLDRISQTEIAEKIGCTRALVSHYARFWNKTTGLRCRMQKREGACDAYRAASKRGWAKRRGEEVESTDALDHAGPSPCEGPFRDDDDDQDFIGDDHLPSWERGRADDGDNMDAVAD